MEPYIKRVHYYHADASALGANLETPIQQLVPVQAPLSLPAVGGYATARVENFNHEGIFSFKSAQTQVAGSVSPKNGGFSTMVTTAIEGLNVLDVITVDRMVAKIMTEHPAEASDGYDPKVSFVGTRFEGLKIGGYEVKVTLDLDLCDQGDATKYPGKPCFGNKKFLDAVGAQYADINNKETRPDWVKKRDQAKWKELATPNWLKERYQWDNARHAARGMVPCSLVKKVDGEFPGTPYGHVLEVPEVGKIFLAELLVDHNAFRLIMMRLELGCGTKGNGGIGGANVEGRTAP